METMKTGNNKLRKKLKNLKVTDFQTTMLVQLSTASVAMNFNKQLVAEIDNECKSRDINVDKFMEQGFPLVTGDINVIFELENFYNMKVKEEENMKEIDLKLAKNYYNKTVEYSKMLIEGKVNPQAAMMFPSMMGHFLFNEFGVYNIQILDFTDKYLQQDESEYETNFIRLIFKEIFFSEKGRKIIFEMMEMQMQMMAQMMGGGGPPGMMGGGGPPGMMGGMPPGMDPSMMGGMPPGMDPGMMGLPPGMDPGMMGGMPPGMDPGMMGGMPPGLENASRKKYKTVFVF